MHALNARTYSKYVSADAFRICAGLREEGKIRHLGMSFHDSADVLDKILDEQPGIEFVQLQINYLDWESETVQARKCYETCQKHGKKVIVMEPVKGGTLSQLLPEADSVFDRLEGRMSNAAYALRFVMGLENVSVILSGMSTPAQIEENTDLFLSSGPLSDEEMKAVDEVRDITLRHGAIACTACRYCTEVCPVGMPVPEIFSLMNSGKEEGYGRITEKTKAGDCLHCGKCEAACPQHLPVRRYLDEGLKVGLATDVAGGSSLSLLRMVSDAVQSSKVRWRIADGSLEPLSLSEAFYLASKGGGSFFGKVGSFEAGYDADIAVIARDADRASRLLQPGIEERLESVIYRSAEMPVEAKYIRGRKVRGSGS